MTGIATQIDELRLAVGEIDALAALALESFDRANWSGADQLLVERTGYVLGMIARSAAAAASKLDIFHPIPDELFHLIADELAGREPGA